MHQEKNLEKIQEIKKTYKNGMPSLASMYYCKNDSLQLGVSYIKTNSTIPHVSIKRFCGYKPPYNDSSVEIQFFFAPGETDLTLFQTLVVIYKEISGFGLKIYYKKDPSYLHRWIVFEGVIPLDCLPMFCSVAGIPSPCRSDLENIGINPRDDYEMKSTAKVQDYSVFFEHEMVCDDLPEKRMYQNEPLTNNPYPEFLFAQEADSSTIAIIPSSRQKDEVMVIVDQEEPLTYERKQKLTSLGLSQFEGNEFKGYVPLRKLPKVCVDAGFRIPDSDDIDSIGLTLKHDDWEYSEEKAVIINKIEDSNFGLMDILPNGTEYREITIEHDKQHFLNCFIVRVFGCFTPERKMNMFKMARALNLKNAWFSRLDICLTSFNVVVPPGKTRAFLAKICCPVPDECTLQQFVKDDFNICEAGTHEGCLDCDVEICSNQVLKFIPYECLSEKDRKREIRKTKKEIRKHKLFLKKKEAELDKRTKKVEERERKINESEKANEPECEANGFKCNNCECEMPVKDDAICEDIVGDLVESEEIKEDELDS